MEDWFQGSAEHRGLPVAVEDKFDRLTRLMTTGKEKGYVLYDEVSELLPTDLNGGADLDDLLAGLDVAGIEILEEPKLDAKIEEAEELLDLDLLPPRAATRPTILYACTCAKWARFRCSRARAKSKSPSASSVASTPFSRRSHDRRW